MSNRAAEILKKIQYETGKTLEEIGAEIGYSRPYLNNVKLKGGGEKIIGILETKYANILQKVSSAATATAATQPIGKFETKDPLTALIESNRDLAESNKILAQSHADLVLLMRQSTAGESAEKLKADVSMFGAILEHLAKIGVRAGEWKSVDEALRAVGRTANDKNKGVQKVRS